MKGMITSNSIKETEVAYLAYQEWVKKNGHNFKVYKAPSKISHKIEKASELIAKKEVKEPE